MLAFRAFVSCHLVVRAVISRQKCQATLADCLGRFLFSMPLVDFDSGSFARSKRRTREPGGSTRRLSHTGTWWGFNRRGAGVWGGLSICFAIGKPRFAPATTARIGLLTGRSPTNATASPVGLTGRPFRLIGRVRWPLQRLPPATEYHVGTTGAFSSCDSRRSAEAQSYPANWGWGLRVRRSI